jgi:hypothetical protein
MAIKKANTLHPSQTLNPQPTAGHMPVKSHVYQTFAELNSAFEKVILDLGNLKQINYLRSETLTALYNMLLRIRAQVSREFISALSEREAANAVYFEGLCGQRTLGSPQTNTQ